MAILPWRKKAETSAAPHAVTAAPHAVTAAAIPLEGPSKIRVGRTFKTGQNDWQKEALYYYDAVGEFRSAVTWIANAVSKAELHAAEVDPETGTIGEATDDTRVQAAAQTVLGGIACRGQLLQTLAVLWQVPGEAFIIVRPSSRPGQPDDWLVLSARNVTYKGDTWTYTDPKTLQVVTLTPRDLLIRVWAPHPDDPFQSDSAARPALPILREIEKASQNIAARLDSRLAGNGVWLFPSEASFPTADGMSKAESVMDFFMTAAEASLKNPGQASAQVPIVVEVPGEQIPNATGGFLDFSTAFDAAVVDLRTNALERLAQTLDMPNETATGSTGGMNHWGAWQVEESTYKIYIEPLLDRIGDALTEQYLRPALTAMGVADPDRYILAWDTTGIVSRPDRQAELKELWDDLLISDDYRRQQAGIPDDAVPTPAEVGERRAWVLAQADPSLAAQYAEELGLPETDSGPDASDGGPPAIDAPADNARALPAADTTTEPPDGLVAAAEMLVFDALSRAGKRLLTRSNASQFAATPVHELYRVVDHDRDPGWLLKDSFVWTDSLADSFRLDRERLATALRAYTTMLLVDRGHHDRAALRRALR